eukprot:12406798-Alexandrium_andersonii.AAC.1
MGNDTWATVLPNSFQLFPTVSGRFLEFPMSARLAEARGPSRTAQPAFIPFHTFPCLPPGPDPIAAAM